MMKFSTTALVVVALVASVGLADQFVSVNDWTYRSDDPAATDVVFRVTMTFTPAADLPGTDNKYEYSVENLTDDLTATLFRVANPDDLPRTMSGPAGWSERVGAQNFVWEGGEILPGATVGPFEALTPGLLPNLVTPPFDLEARGWIMAHYVGEEPGQQTRIDVFGPIVHMPVEVYVDIKPGSCPNPFNSKSKGSVPVAIVGTAEFDVTTVDPESICLVSPDGTVVCALEQWVIIDSTEPNDGDPAQCFDCFDAEANWNCDLDGDGVDDSYCGDDIDDLVVKFDTRELAAAIRSEPRGGCVVLMLTGETQSGVPILGSDSVLKKK
jgi:hypothetical protein